MWRKLVLLGLAGMGGTLARYGLSGLVQRNVDSAFPWGTAVVNATGCLVFGAVWAATSERLTVSPEVRVYALTGFLGAFTTFSTFVSESSQLLADGEFLRSGGYMLLQNATGTALFFIGMAVGRLL